MMMVMMGGGWNGHIKVIRCLTETQIVVRIEQRGMIGKFADQRCVRRMIGKARCRASATTRNTVGE